MRQRGFHALNQSAVGNQEETEYMDCKVENTEKNMVKLTITVPAEDFKKAVTEAYNKNRGKYSVPGFRKGHAPQALIEKEYGKGAFYDDAVNKCIDDTYPEAVKEKNLEVVSRPEIEIPQIGDGKDLIYTASVAVRPEVTLGDYKGIEVKKADMEVTDKELEDALKQEQERNARLVTIEDRAAAMGDSVTIDFDGSVDGKPFEGGKGEKYPLELGSKSFIEGFEEQVAGHKTGEEFDVNVTFPEKYQAVELSGKPAVFHVKIEEIKKKELPELNDEFAGEVSEFDTLDAYKADLKKRLTEDKAKKAATENENNVIKKVVENAKMDIPAPMIETQTRQMVEDYARRMQSQGIPLDQYMKVTGMTPEKLKEQFKPQAEERIRTRLTLEEIVKKENIKIADDAVDKEIDRMAQNYKIEPDKMQSYINDEQRKQMEEDLKVNEAVDFLVAEAKLV